MEKMNKEQLISELEKINITLTEEQMNQLEIYKDFLIECMGCIPGVCDNFFLQTTKLM